MPFPGGSQTVKVSPGAYELHGTQAGDMLSLCNAFKVRRDQTLSFQGSLILIDPSVSPSAFHRRNTPRDQLHNPGLMRMAGKHRCYMAMDGHP